MHTERVFNIFVYFDDGMAVEYGVRYHKIEGDDRQKAEYLQNRVAQDYAVARHFRFRRTFTAEEWRAQLRLGNVLVHFEEAFALFHAPASPVFCVTAVGNGAPAVDQKIEPGPFRGAMVSEQPGLGSVPDYLVHYTNGNSFRITDLIHDDYFKAIRALFNATLYVSCSKLLMSCLDTLAFVEFGDVSGNFLKWVDTYVDLYPLGISSAELWEYRNSVLHMTNLASRKVVAGKISPIMPFVGSAGHMPPITPGFAKPFNLFGLIEAVAHGIGKWGETHNSDGEKILKFIERYDTTISDSRMAWVGATDGTSDQLAR